MSPVAGRIPQQTINEILDRTDLVELIGERVQLKRAGKDWKGLCPFHNEKSPSFTVSRDKGLYYCFGCQAGGNAIGFLEAVDNLSFIEAIEMLAEKAGVTIETEALGEARNAQRVADPLFELLQRTSDYYRRALAEDEAGAEARAYAENRGLSDEVAETFEIGWAPAGWDRLVRKLHKADVNPRLALDAGLVAPRNEGAPPSWENLRDKFVDRLIFPIHDGRGRVIGFGGRALRDDQMPKYLNSPTTALFHKGKVLYNFHRARKDIREDSGVIVVEGYMDLIALWRAGVTNAVATLGVALTEDHARLLRRYTRKVTLLFDSDQAGRQAAFKSLAVLLPQGMDPYRVMVEGGKDPDDLLEREGPEAVQALVQQTQPLLDLFLDELAGDANKGGSAEMERAVGRGAEILALIPDPIALDRAVEGFAQRLNVSPDRMRASLRRASARRRVRPRRSDDPDENRAERAREMGMPEQMDERERSERFLVALCLQIPRCMELSADQEVPELLSNQSLRNIYEAGLEAGTAQEQGFHNEVIQILQGGDAPAEEIALAARLMNEPLRLSSEDTDPNREEEERIEESLESALRKLERYALLAERADLQRQLRELANAEEPLAHAELSQRLLDVNRRLSS